MILGITVPKPQLVATCQRRVAPVELHLFTHLFWKWMVCCSARAPETASKTMESAIENMLTSWRSWQSIEDWGLNDLAYP